MKSDDVGTFLEKYTYENILEEALNNVPEGIDIREGSIIYDALAPACYQLAEFYMNLKTVMQDSFIETAIGEYLDLKVAERGLKRLQSTKALRIGTFEDAEGKPFDVPLEARFSSIEPEGRIFKVISKISEGKFNLEAEDSGTIGNNYYGDLLPVDNISGLSKAVLGDVVTPGQNTESDDDLRNRYFSNLRQTSFGGNWDDYVDVVSALTGVGAVQVYPIWNGGGTVKVSILDTDLNTASNPFVESIKKELDPDDSNGSGYGLAPIGHHVTVTTPTVKKIDVSVHIDALIGYTEETVKAHIVEAIESYFLTLRRSWSDSDDLHNYGQTVYRSQIIAAILQVEGLANASNVLLNGSEKDIPLTMNGKVQEVAFLGKVDLT